MWNNIVRSVPSYFKIISMLLFCLSTVICFDYLGIILLFCILLFVTIRSDINISVYILPIYEILILVFLCFICHLHFIYIFKIILILCYIKYLLAVNNYLTLDNSLTKIFRYGFFKIIKKYDILKSYYKLNIKTNYSLYSKKNRFKSLYLAYMEVKNDNMQKIVNSRNYLIVESKKNVYDYLFVIMHALCLIFCLFLEVYR